MTQTSSAVSPGHTTMPALRLWPGVLLAALVLIVRFVVPLLVPGSLAVGAIAGVVGSLLILVWWLFFSRAPLSLRALGAVLVVGGLFLTSLGVHESIKTAGMGLLFYIYALPATAIVLVLFAVISRSLRGTARMAALVATMVLSLVPWLLVRTGGISGDADSDFAWRWSKTAEDRLMEAGEQAPNLRRVAATADLPEQPAWPGFRGADRSGVVAGSRVATDWQAAPPQELWRRAIGPGWSSFAVAGERIYTQEQRGEHELITCYHLTTGEPIWRHQDQVRFWESKGTAQVQELPRSFMRAVCSRWAPPETSTCSTRSRARRCGQATSLGMDRLLTQRSRSRCGGFFSGSPVVVDELVLVAAAGQLLAYNVARGDLAWKLDPGSSGYSSPHPVTLGGTAQVVLAGSRGVRSVLASSGTELWSFETAGEPIVQPAVLPDGDLIIASTGESGGLGLVRLAVEREPSSGSWQVTERWSSRGLKPNFSDYVLHNGNAYGFDGGILSSVDLSTGKRNWKGGRYGHGQMLLLAQQDTLLVLGEDGDLALVAAQPDGFLELASHPALDGKTWNHPVLVDDLLLVRNGEEMAAFRLQPAET